MDPATSTPTSTPPNSRGKKGFAPWVKAHKVEVGIGGAGAVGLLALVMHKKASSTATPASSSTTAASGQPAGTTASTTLSPLTGGPQLGDWGTNQLDALQAEITQIEAELPSTSPGPTGIVTPLQPITPAGAVSTVSPGGTQQPSIAGLIPQTYGTQTAAAAPYELGQEVINGSGWSLFDFPGGTSPATEAQDLYGSDPTGLATLEAANPSDPSLTGVVAVPLYPGQGGYSGPT